MPLPDGPPDWATAPTRSAGPPLSADDATLVPELSTVGARIRLFGVEEEEAGWGLPRKTERLLPVEHLEAIAQVLVSGVEHTRTIDAWGRSYASTWSFGAPSEVFSQGEHLWFYPMDQERRVLRVAPGPLRDALIGCVSWFEAQPGLPSGDRIVLARVGALIGSTRDGHRGPV